MTTPGAGRFNGKEEYARWITQASRNTEGGRGKEGFVE
jgi:hypothetical protein